VLIFRQLLFSSVLASRQIGSELIDLWLMGKDSLKSRGPVNVCAQFDGANVKLQGPNCSACLGTTTRDSWKSLEWGGENHLFTHKSLTRKLSTYSISHQQAQLRP